MFLDILKSLKIKLILLLSFIISFLFSANDKIEYYGNWPINHNKQMIIDNSNTNKLDCPTGIGCNCLKNDECINNFCAKDLRGNRYCGLKEGDTFPHFKALDQFNEIVDIYDFANNEGKYILIEMGTVWCGPCNSLASWLAWDEETIKSKPFWKDEYNAIKELINNKDIHFITILYEDEFRDNASYDTAYEWHDTYPNDLVPVLIDEDKLLHSIIRPTGIPAITLISPEMEIIQLSTRGLNQAFDKLLSILNKNK